MQIEIEKKEEFGNTYFAAMLDDKQIGEANYYTSPDGAIHITHVGIDSGFRGEGLAQQLVEKVVEYARANAIKIVPHCSYARAMFQRHPDYGDVLQ